MGKTVLEPSHRQLNTPLSDREYAVLNELSAKTGITSKPEIMRMALRIYQVLHENPELMAQVEKAYRLPLVQKLNPEATP